MSKAALTLKEKICYGLGQSGCSLVSTMVGTYLLYFYTDVYGLSASLAGTMFLVSRFLDGIGDIAFGVVVDKTNTRWGKCRPYLLWCAAPVAIFSVMAFMAPRFGGNEVLILIYVYITYNALSLALTGISLPLGAMVVCMTNNAQERTMLYTTGAFFGLLGLLVASYATMPLVKSFSHNGVAQGFQMTMMLYGALTFSLCLIAFWNTKERIVLSHTKAATVQNGFRALKNNPPWLFVTLTIVVYWIAVMTHNQTTVYYCKYNCSRPDLIPTVMATMIAALPATLVAKPIATRYGKRNTMLIGCALAAVGLVVIGAGAGASVEYLIGGNLLFAFGKGMMMGLFGAILADTVDYAEWKTSIRAPGIHFAGSAFAVKVGMGIAGALTAWLLERGDYVPNIPQSHLALEAIEWSYVWVPLVAVILVAVLLGCYRLDSQHCTILSDLEQRREGKTVSA